MPRIVSVSVCSVSVPLDRAASFSTRVVKARDYCLVKVRSAEGIEGSGFCYSGNMAGSVARVAAEELLAPQLVGEESTRVEGLWDKMYREALLHGRAGSVMRALSALDIALWDLNARAAGLPLYRYMGYSAKDAVPAYASGGYFMERKTPKDLAKELSAFAASGFKAIKIKVARLSPPEEEERVRAAREAIGPDVRLMLDANNAWTDLPTALNYCKRYEKYDPYWIEEPFSPDDLENHAKLAARLGLSIATGEIEAGRWRFKELLDKKAADILQPDAAVCGGITEWRRIAQTAASYGVSVSPHWLHDFHVHLAASCPNACYVEFFPNDQVLNFGRLIDRRVEMKNGELMLPQGPGLGFDFDERAVAKYAANHEQPWTVVNSA